MKTEICRAYNTDELADKIEQISNTFGFQTIIQVIRTTSFSYYGREPGLVADYIIIYK